MSSIRTARVSGRIILLVRVTPQSTMLENPVPKGIVLILAFEFNYKMNYKHLGEAIALYYYKICLGDVYLEITSSRFTTLVGGCCIFEGKHIHIVLSQ